MKTIMHPLLIWAGIVALPTRLLALAGASPQLTGSVLSLGALGVAYRFGRVHADNAAACRHVSAEVAQIRQELTRLVSAIERRIRGLERRLSKLEQERRNEEVA